MVECNVKKFNVIVVSGNFDPLHKGHKACINEALCLGNFVVIILTRDDQVLQKKGYCFQKYDDREKELLDFVGNNGVVVMNVDPDIASSQSLRMYKHTYHIDAFAKGGNDWNENNLPERDVCKELGIVMLFGVGGFDKKDSSSDIVRRGNLEPYLKVK